MLRIGLLFCALTLCAYVHALWTAGHRQDLHDNVQDLGFGFPESFVADAAQADGLRIALVRWTGREAEARAGRR